MKKFDFNEIVLLNTARDVYYVDSELVKRTLTIGELIDILSRYDVNAPVLFRNDGGYTYAALDKYDSITSKYPENLIETEDEDDLEESHRRKIQNKLLKESKVTEGINYWDFLHKIKEYPESELKAALKTIVPKRLYNELVDDFKWTKVGNLLGADHKEKLLLKLQKIHSDALKESKLTEAKVYQLFAHKVDSNGKKIPNTEIKIENEYGYDRKELSKKAEEYESSWNVNPQGDIWKVVVRHVYTDTEKPVKESAHVIPFNFAKKHLKNKNVTESPEYELKPKYDSRKSFYGKAEVDSKDGVETLYSYGTKVAEIRDNKVTLFPAWDSSQTTLRHVKEFLKQFGFEASSIQQMRKDYIQK